MVLLQMQSNVGFRGSMHQIFTSSFYGDSGLIWKGEGACELKLDTIGLQWIFWFLELSKNFVF